ncbi:MAG TPA: response regulator [candidate division WOR-3 bacterium]|uniref:Response regulator n=1 Tax=candidate division WOR-3 bacterium TaxID=2052148 RepID=A0A7V0XEP4_UNCW3|nr:response regulator [candidate division WOR-3 bacterium]
MAESLPLLLVDDNNGIVETLADILSINGFEVTAVTDAERALRQAETTEFALAVIDLVLPGLNGIELINRLRAAHPAMKFVVITAYTDTELARQAMAMDIGGVVFKPVEPHEMVRLIRRVAGLAAN